MQSIPLNWLRHIALAGALVAMAVHSSTAWPRPGLGAFAGALAARAPAGGLIIDYRAARKATSQVTVARSATGLKVTAGSRQYDLTLADWEVADLARAAMA